MVFGINTALSFFRPAVKKQTPQVVETALKTGAQILQESATTVKPSAVIDTFDFSEQYAGSLAEKKLRDTYGGLEGAVAHLFNETSSLQNSITQRSKAIIKEASTIRGSEFLEGGDGYQGMLSGRQTYEQAMRKTLARAGGQTDKYTAASIESMQVTQKLEVAKRDYLQDNALFPMLDKLRKLKGTEYVDNFLDSIRNQG
ncbi:MAG: hypothetical protein ACKO34_02870 [Vampirovibrionales bacterium]